MRSDLALGNGAPLVFLGGLIGASARVGMGELLPLQAGAWPTATFLVNLIGAFLLGLYLARHDRGTSDGRGLHLWGVGALGTFTTFSALSNEVVALVDEGSGLLAAGYVVASVVGGLVVAFLGARVGGLVE